MPDMTGKPEGAHAFVTCWGNVLLSQDEAKQAQDILASDSRSSINRLQKRLLADFFSLLAKDEMDEMYA